MQKAKSKMRNTEGRQVILCTLYFLLYGCAALFVFGCEGAFQLSYDQLGTVSVDGLVPEATQIIQDGLADDNPIVRANAIEVVAGTKRIKLMPKVQRLLKDEFVPVRFLAALAIGDLEYSLAKSKVAQLLSDEDENVRIASAYAMSKFSSAGSLDVVRKAIASSDQKVKANAALLLGKGGDKSVLKFLYWALRHKGSDYKVKFNAVEAIARLGDERIYPKLWTMLISAYADDRVVGIRSMGALGTVEARNALITMLDDDVLEVRLAAAEQLGMLGDGIGEAEVLDVFKKNLISGMGREGAVRVKVWTALAIGQIGTASLTKFLPQLLEDESKFVRIAAAKAVFQCTMRG